MSIIDNQRIIIKVCKLYYIERLSQKEISEKLLISRPQISRILAYAKDNNMISIQIKNPFSVEGDLEDIIAKKYNLSDVVVFDNASDGNHDFYDSAAKHIEAYIPENATVGVMGGHTICEMVKRVSTIEKRGVSFIPIVGGYGMDGADWYANRVAENFAHKASGRYYLLNAPAMVQSIESARVLKNEPAISEILSMAESCHVSIVGVGTIDNISTASRIRLLTDEEMQSLKEEGAVADCCASFISSSGQIIHSDNTNRMIGLPLPSLKTSKTIAIAIGEEKAEAIKAVLSSRYIDILFTDRQAAEHII